MSMVSFSSCQSSKQADCPAYGNATTKANKKTGKLPTKRGRSNLFPKGMRN